MYGTGTGRGARRAVLEGRAGAVWRGWRCCLPPRHLSSPRAAIDPRPRAAAGPAATATTAAPAAAAATHVATVADSATRVTVSDYPIDDANVCTASAAR